MEEKILREILATTKENNDILRKLNFQRKFYFFYWVLKWAVIAFVAYTAYIAATPYIESAQQTMNNVNALSNQKSFADFLRSEINKRMQP